MIEHLINSNDLKKNRNKEVSPRPRRDNISSFGPSLGKLKQLDITKKVRKMIHYDCNENANLDGIDDDVPDEDEVYVKENLLMNIKEKQMRDKENQITESNNEDPSIVNINVSILFSEETISNSKNNSLTFNYSPDSTSRMNNTKDQFNSAKKTLRSNLNKSNSNHNLLTENTFTFNTQTSNYNTLNSNNSKDKKGESPGNPYLMEKITSMLNKNTKMQMINSNNNNNKINLNLDFGSRSNTNREFIRNEFNNVNIQNINYTNNSLSPKNVLNIKTTDNNNAFITKPNKVISDNLNKNLLYIMQNNSNKKLNQNSDIKGQNSSESNNQKNNFVNLSKLKSALETNNTRLMGNYKTNQKRKFEPSDYLSPPSSKKRLEDKFYNYTENNKYDQKVSHLNSSIDEQSKDEFMIKQTLTNVIHEKQKQFVVAKNNAANAAKFDYSRYNYKSQDLTGLIQQRKKLKENNVHANAAAEVKKIISNESRGGENLKMHSDNNMGLSKSNNTCNVTVKESGVEKMRVSDKKIFINTPNDKNPVLIVNKNSKPNLNSVHELNEEKDIQIASSRENNSVEKGKEEKAVAEPKKENVSLKNSVEKTGKAGKIIKGENEKEKSTLMIRDIKSLHLITQKALTTKNNIYLQGDAIEEEKKKVIPTTNSTKKALYIDDNSDMPVGVAKSQDPFTEAKNKETLDINYDNVLCKTDSHCKSPHSNSFTFSNSLNGYNISEKDRKQIINIININNNYNIGNLNFNLNENIYSMTNPNSNMKESNNINQPNAFLMPKESNVSKNISNSHSNVHKSKNRINNTNSNIANNNLNKNVSAFDSNYNKNNAASNNSIINNNNKKYFENLSHASSNNLSNLNNLNSNILLKQQISVNNSNSNISSLKNISDLNTPRIMGKNGYENKQAIFNKENNFNLNAINEYFNTSKDKNIPNTSKNSMNSASNNNFLIGYNSSNKHLGSDNKIKDILRSYKKEENSSNKNQFIKISSSTKK